MSLHFYDGQIRRYITQIIRMLSHFSYKDGDGDFKRVPILYGDMSRQAASILGENSENKIPSAPRIAVYITGLDIDRNRTSDSSYVSKVHIRERAYDQDNNEYLNIQGKNYTVERLMPTPYKLTVNADIWSTNTDQKLQIIEQILTLFNPSLEIQTTDNYVDWASLTTVDLDAVNFTSRTIPAGTESPIDVCTLTFSTPIWLSSPVKVKKMGVITNIIANIFNEDTGTIDLGLSAPQLNQYDNTPSGRIDLDNRGLPETTNNIPGFLYNSKIQIDENYKTRNGLKVRIYNITGMAPRPVHGAYLDANSNSWILASWSDEGKYSNNPDEFNDLDLLSVNSAQRHSITGTVNNAEVVAVNYMQFNVYVEGETAQLVKNGSTRKFSWKTVLEAYAERFIPGVSRIYLTRLDLDIMVAGTFTLDESDSSILNVAWDVDTYPSNTPIGGRTNVDYIIEPSRFNPTQIKQPGMRFLLLGNVGDTANNIGPVAWNQSNGSNFIASKDDIIEWTGSDWTIVFDASMATSPVFTTNLNTKTQYMWTGSEWIESLNGDYPAGSWRIEP